MLLEGSFTIAAPRERVAEFFSRVDNIARVIPGCVEHRAEDADQVIMVIEQKVAWLKGRFTVTMRVVENKLPDEITSQADGRDSLTGSSLKIVNNLRLEEPAPGETTIRYRMEVSVFGKLGSLGFFAIKAKAQALEQEFIVATRAVLESLAESAEGSVV